MAVNLDAAALDASCDVLVVGGGMEGVAAAWAAARRGHRVRLLEETDWLGGQITSQGVAALDEHPHIETFGGTRSYYGLCEAIRDHYRALAGHLQEPLNPGRCWVSRLGFEPRVAVDAINHLLAETIQAGRLSVFLRTKAVKARMDGDQVLDITAIKLDSGRAVRFAFAYVLDVTELGDVLPLTGTEHVVGAESVSRTNEPHAQPDEAKPYCVQSCTHTFALERRPEGESHRIPQPTRYEYYRDR